MTKLLNEPLDDEEAISSDSDDDEHEIINYEVHDSESEEELTDRETEEEQMDDENEFYLGKDKKTKWYKTPCRSKYAKTKPENIVKIFPSCRGQKYKNELESFFSLFDSDIVDEILQCTNNFIGHKKEEVNYSRDRDGNEMTKAELLAVFGLLFLVGIKKENHTNVLELWTNDGSGLSIVRACMSYKRFLFLLRCIRFDDRGTRQSRQATDKLAPIRSVMEKFRQNCLKRYSPGEFVTIDEKLEAFRGRCSFIQYISNKPAKYGIKVYALCDAKTFYTHNFEVYCGKQPEGPYQLSNKPHDIVLRLSSPIWGTGRNITMDNWYGSIPLVQSLFEKKITCLGTLKKNKTELPVEFQPNKKKAILSTMAGFQKTVTLISHVPKKNKCVFLISSMHDDAKIDEETNKPEMILDYNMTKGGVDTVDQMCSSYSVSRINRRWPLTLFFSFMNMAGINALVLYQLSTAGQKLQRRLFLKSLAYDLMKPHLIERARIPTLPLDIRVFLEKYRENSNDEGNSGEPPAKKPKGRCAPCGRKKNVTTTMTCHKCNQFCCKNHSIKTIVCLQCSEDLS